MKKEGKNTVKPIFGTEFYVCDDLTVKTRTADGSGDERDRRHQKELRRGDSGRINGIKHGFFSFLIVLRLEKLLTVGFSVF